MDFQGLNRPMGFPPWIWIVFALDPDTGLMGLSLPWLLKSFREWHRPVADVDRLDVRDYFSAVSH
jgi:hypothetical protein